ncbi:hypothetical protein CSUI_007986 [Cystoisospora suis]|uniref:Uncharacterized protein n=1 Tax=Cystoisospora suis TaxID=483139 RepID=A0A2C6KNY8_9APIC|nr:hypothetical protein CSUI_007986 [Cystoisospora suis]
MLARVLRNTRGTCPCCRKYRGGGGIACSWSPWNACGDDRMIEAVPYNENVLMDPDEEWKKRERWLRMRKKKSNGRRRRGKSSSCSFASMKSFSLGAFLRATRKLHEARIALKMKEEREGSHLHGRAKGGGGGGAGGGGDLCMSIGRPYFRIITETLIPSSLVDTSIAVRWWRLRQGVRKRDASQETTPCMMCAEGGRFEREQGRAAREDEEEDVMRRDSFLSEEKRRQSDSPHVGMTERGEEDSGLDVNKKEAWREGGRGLYGKNGRRGCSCCDSHGETFYDVESHHERSWRSRKDTSPRLCNYYDEQQGERRAPCLCACFDGGTAPRQTCRRRRDEDEEEDSAFYRRKEGAGWRGDREGRGGGYCPYSSFCGEGGRRYQGRDRKSLYQSFSCYDKNLDLVDSPYSSSSSRWRTSSFPSHVWVTTSISEWKPLHGISMLRIVAQGGKSRGLSPLFAEGGGGEEATSFHQSPFSQSPPLFSSLFCNQLSTFMCIEALKLLPRRSASSPLRQKNESSSYKKKTPRGMGERNHDEDGEEDQYPKRLSAPPSTGFYGRDKDLSLGRDREKDDEDEEEEEEDYSAFSYGFNVSLGMYQPDEEDQHTYDPDLVYIPDPEQINEALLGNPFHMSSSSCREEGSLRPPASSSLVSSSSSSSSSHANSKKKKKSSKAMNGETSASTLLTPEMAHGGLPTDSRERRRGDPRGHQRRTKREGEEEEGRRRQEDVEDRGEDEKYFDIDEDDRSSSFEGGGGQPKNEEDEGRRRRRMSMSSSSSSSSSGELLSSDHDENPGGRYDDDDAEEERDDLSKKKKHLRKMVIQEGQDGKNENDSNEIDQLHANAQQGCSSSSSFLPSGLRQESSHPTGTREKKKKKRDDDEEDSSIFFNLQESFLSLFSPIQPSHHIPAYIPPTLAAGISCKRLNFPISVCLDARLSSHKYLGLPHPYLLSSSSARGKESAAPHQHQRISSSSHTGQRGTSWSVSPSRNDITVDSCCPRGKGIRQGGRGEMFSFSSSSSSSSSYLCRDCPVLLWSWVFPGGGGIGGPGASVPLRITGLLPQLRRRLSHIRRLQEDLLHLLVDVSERRSRRDRMLPHLSFYRPACERGGGGDLGYQRKNHERRDGCGSSSYHREAKCRARSSHVKREDERDMTTKRDREDKESGEGRQRVGCRCEDDDVDERGRISCIRRTDQGRVSDKEIGEGVRRDQERNKGSEAEDREDLLSFSEKGEEEEENKDIQKSKEDEDEASHYHPTTVGSSSTRPISQVDCLEKLKASFDGTGAAPSTSHEQANKSEEEEKDEEEEEDVACKIDDLPLGDPTSSLISEKAGNVSGSSCLTEQSDILLSTRQRAKATTMKGSTAPAGARGGEEEEETGGLAGKKKKHHTSTKEKKSSSAVPTGVPHRHQNTSNEPRSKKDRSSRGDSGGGGKKGAGSSKKSRDSHHPHHGRTSVSPPSREARDSSKKNKSSKTGKADEDDRSSGVGRKDKNSKERSPCHHSGYSRLNLSAGKEEEEDEGRQGGEGDDGSSITTMTGVTMTLTTATTASCSNPNKVEEEDQQEDSLENKKIQSEGVGRCPEEDGDDASHADKIKADRMMRNEIEEEEEARGGKDWSVSTATHSGSSPRHQQTHSSASSSSCCSSSSSSCGCSSPSLACSSFPTQPSSSSCCRIRQKHQEPQACASSCSCSSHPKLSQSPPSSCGGSSCPSSFCCFSSSSRKVNGEAGGKASERRRDMIHCCCWQRRKIERRGDYEEDIYHRETRERERRRRIEECASCSCSLPSSFSLTPRLLLEEIKKTGGELLLRQGGNVLNGEALVQQRFIVDYAFQFDPDALHSDPQCIANGGTTNTRRHRRDGMSGHEDQLTGLDFLYFSRLCVLEGGPLFSSSHLLGTSQQFTFSREDEEEEDEGCLQGEERNAEVHRHSQYKDDDTKTKKKMMRESVTGTPSASSSSASGLGSIVEPSDELLVELFKNVYLDDEEEIDEEEEEDGEEEEGDSS